MLFQPARYMGLKPAGAQNAFGYPKLSMNFCPRQATSAGAKVVLRLDSLVHRTRPGAAIGSYNVHASVALCPTLDGSPLLKNVF